METINFKFTKLAVSLATAMTLASCGGTGQDEGEANATANSPSGKTIDGYLSEAFVYIDADNNGTRGPNEPFAQTDTDGYYTFNPLTGVNYCQGTTDTDAKRCLQTRVDYGDVVIRIEDGTDVTTGEEFKGQLSRRVNLSAGNVDVIISPITTLLTNVPEQDQDEILTALDIDESDLDVDYLNAQGNDEVDAKLFNTAVTLHKTVTVLADSIDDNYEEITEETGTANDATSGIYDALAEAIVETVQNSTDTPSIDEIVSDPAVLVEVLDVVEEEVRQEYVEQELSVPAEISNNKIQAVAEVAAQVPAVVDAVIDETATDLTRTEIDGSAKAIEAVVVKVVDTNNIETDQSIDNAIEFFTDESNQGSVEELTQVLQAENSDVVGLSENDFSDVEEVKSVAVLPDDAEAIDQLAGMKLRIGEPNWGTSTNNLDDLEFEFYFLGEPSDNEGDFVACYKYIDGASLDSQNNLELGEGNTRGSRIEGTWTRTNGFTLQVTIEHLNTKYSSIIKPVGMDKALLENVSHTLSDVEIDAFVSDINALLGDQSLEDYLVANSAQLDVAWRETMFSLGVSNHYLENLFSGYLGTETPEAAQLAALLTDEQTKYRFKFLTETVEAYSVAGLQPYNEGDIPANNIECQASLPILNPDVRAGLDN